MVVVAAIGAIILVLVVVFIVALHHFNFLASQVGRDPDLAIEKSFCSRQRQADSGGGQQSLAAAGAAAVALGAEDRGGG